MDTAVDVSGTKLIVFSSEWFILCRPSAEQIQEVSAFSKDSLEKIEKSRLDGDYSEVRHCAPLLRCESCIALRCPPPPSGAEALQRVSAEAAGSPG